MINGKTKSGFKYAVDENTVKSWSFVEACTLMLSEDATEQIKGSVAYVNAVLGNQKSELVKHIEKKNGTCSTESMLLEVSEIVNSIKALKN